MGAVSGQSFISGGRPPVLRFAWQLYQSDDSFRGLVDFAILGSMVLLFLDPWAMQSARNLTDRAFSVVETLVSQRIERMSPGVAPEARPKGAELPPPQHVAASSAPADTPHDVNAPPTMTASPPAVKSTTGPPTGAALGPPLATQTPAVSPSNDERRTGQTTSPGESKPTVPKQIDVPMPLAAVLKSPRLMSFFLIEIDESPFRSSSSADQQRLKKATADYRSMRFDVMMEELVHARSTDANVLFLR